MTPVIFVQKLSMIPHSKLGISSLAVLSSTEDKVVVTVSLNAVTTVHMFLVNVATNFPEFTPSLSDLGVLELDHLTLSSTSSAPGRCHFSVQRVIQ